MYCGIGLHNPLEEGFLVFVMYYGQKLSLATPL
jgi:hypothetical protein